MSKADEVFEKYWIDDFDEVFEDKRNHELKQALQELEQNMLKDELEFLNNIKQRDVWLIDINGNLDFDTIPNKIKELKENINDK